jgi:Flp pilus assembly protein TadG
MCRRARVFSAPTSARARPFLKRYLRTPRFGRIGRKQRNSEHGAVTAETAMVLPMLVVLTMALTWLLSISVTQVRTVDAAREAARAVARDESESIALSLGQQVAPDGATIAVSRAAGSVTVVVRSKVEGPGGLFSWLPGVLVQAEAVAAAEDR